MKHINMQSGIQIIGLDKLPEFKPNDNIVDNMLISAKQSLGGFIDGDIVVITQKIISKVEDCIVDLKTVSPEREALNLAKKTRKDPRLVQLILEESKRVIRVEEQRGIIITETKHGFICANAGIDSSNVPGADYVTTLPADSNESAHSICSAIRKKMGLTHFAVIISDTFGRPWREGQVNFAIGSSGIQPSIDYEGTVDVAGKPLRVTKIAIIDAIAAASELVCGKTNQVPVAVFRGFTFFDSTDNTTDLLRPMNKDLFR